MMKYIIFTGAMVLASAVSGEALARCNQGQGWNRVHNLAAVLTNNGATLGMTACSNAGQGTQEEHHNGGNLYDFKCGPAGYPATSPGTACAKPDIDRRKQLGTWSVAVSGPANNTRETVTYTYNAFGAATSGPLDVFVNGGIYDFCNGNASVGTFTLVPTTGTTRVCP